MKNIFLAATALVALGASSASAADLAARPYTKAPPVMVALYDWTGFYIGANGGYGTSRKCMDFVTGGGLIAADGCHDADGAVGGGQIGYRWQHGPMVYGIEGQGNYADLRGNNVSLVPTITRGTRVDAFGLFTGQVGYSFGQALLYVKGGGAVVGQRFDSFFTATGAGGPGSITGRDTRFGATVGAGVEYAFTPNWSAGVEYNHLFLGTTTYTYPNPTFTERVRGDLDIVTARINYKWGGPVVARY